MSNSSSHPRTVGLLLALLATFCLSIAPALVKVGLTAVNPVPLLALRLLVAAAIFWLVYLLFWPHLLRIDRPGLIACAAAAAANGTSLLLYYLALTRIDASIAHVLFGLHPVAVLLLLALRGERITSLSLVRLGLALAGVYLLVGPGGNVHPIGVGLVVVTAVLYGLHMNIVQWYLSRYRPQTVALYVVSFMAVFLGVIYLFQYEPPSFSATGWSVILITGLISTVVARLAMFGGIQRIGSGQTALFGPTETLLTILWATLFLGERLSLIQLAGGLLILTSAALVIRVRRRVSVGAAAK